MCLVGVIPCITHVAIQPTKDKSKGEAIVISSYKWEKNSDSRNLQFLIKGYNEMSMPKLIILLFAAITLNKQMKTCRGAGGCAAADVTVK